MSEQRTASVYLPTAGVDCIDGNLHEVAAPDADFAVMRFIGGGHTIVGLHVHDPELLDSIAATAARLAGELRDARAKQISELDRLRAEVARLKAAAGETPSETDAAPCGCPRDAGRPGEPHSSVIRHDRAICTDPVVARLGWYVDEAADGRDAG